MRRDERRTKAGEPGKSLAVRQVSAGTATLAEMATCRKITGKFAEIVAKHARTNHQMNVTAKDCETMIKTHQVMVRTGDALKHAEDMMKKSEPTEEKPHM